MSFEKYYWNIVCNLVAVFFMISCQDISSPQNSQEKVINEEVCRTQVVLSNLGHAKGENFLGDNIFYVEGIISNNGTQTIKRIDLTFLFKNSSNQIVLQETRKALQYRGKRGIQPENQADFQVAFENLPEDWNYLIPKILIARIIFQC